MPSRRRDGPSREITLVASGEANLAHQSLRYRMGTETRLARRGSRSRRRRRSVTSSPRPISARRSSPSRLRPMTSSPSTIRVRDGESIVIGGLLRSRKVKRAVRGGTRIVPVLLENRGAVAVDVEAFSRPYGEDLEGKTERQDWLVFRPGRFRLKPRVKRRVAVPFHSSRAKGRNRYAQLGLRIAPVDGSPVGGRS